MPVYNLFLSTLITSPTLNRIVPVNKSNLASVTWNIDWNSFFGYEQQNYKYCRLRFILNSATWVAGATDWDVYSGYLSCNLQSNFASPYLPGTFLGVIYPINCLTTGTTTHCFLISTLQEQGVEISPPIGNQNFTLQFYNDDSFNLMATVPEYTIQLSFELYN